MTPIIRRTFLVAVAVAPFSHVAPVLAVDALPDARFVGFAETVNDFEIKSGQLALTKSSNELVRGYATRTVAEHTKAVQSLSRNRAEAGVTMAPDEDVRKIADDAMTRLNSLQGAEFDTAYANAQLRVQTAAVDQYSAYSRTNGRSGPLRRYAQEALPHAQSFQEYAKRLTGGR
jgi:putative membrane protein